jgi:hypothetical protein
MTMEDLEDVPENPAYGTLASLSNSIDKVERLEAELRTARNDLMYDYMHAVRVLTPIFKSIQLASEKIRDDGPIGDL